MPSRNRAWVWLQFCLFTTAHVCMLLNDNSYTSSAQVMYEWKLLRRNIYTNSGAKGDRQLHVFANTVILDSVMSYVTFKGRVNVYLSPRITMLLQKATVARPVKTYFDYYWTWIKFIITLRGWPLDPILGHINSNQALTSYCFNLLKTKPNLLYIRNQFAPRSKHFPPRLKNQPVNDV